MAFHLRRITLSSTYRAPVLFNSKGRGRPLPARQQAKAMLNAVDVMNSAAEPRNGCVGYRVEIPGAGLAAKNAQPGISNLLCKSAFDSIGSEVFQFKLRQPVPRENFWLLGVMGSGGQLQYVL